MRKTGFRALAFVMVLCITAGLLPALHTTAKAASDWDTAVTDALLCTLTFRVTAETSDEGSPITLTQVKLYDENGSMVPSSVMEGAVARKTVHLRMSVSETAEHQAVRAIVELGGSLSPTGGNFCVSYDPTHFTVTSVLPLDAMDQASYQYNIVKPGLVQISWASPTSYSGEFELLTIEFSQAVEGVVELSDASLYYSEGTPIPVADVRPGKITNAEAVAAVVDTFTEETVGNTSRYTVTVDIADLNYFTGQAIEAVTAALALYENGRLSAITLEPTSQFNNGTGEIQLTAETTDDVSGITIFLMGDLSNMAPLCRALTVQ